MWLFNGQMPTPGSVAHARVSLPSRIELSMCLLILFCSVGSFADTETALTLAEAEQLALENEPGRASILARAESFEEQSVAAGQLSDPKLRLGLVNYPLESGGFRTEGMTQAQIGFRQAFPPGDTRALRTQSLLFKATEMTQSAEARERDVLNALRASWLETFYWNRAREIVSESRPFFSDLVTVTQSLYSVGQKDQQDVLQAELELSRLDDRLIEIDKRHAVAQAALSEWVGHEAVRPLSAELPAWLSIPAHESLRADLLKHPILMAATSRIDVQKTGIELARQRYKPGWALDLGYGYRDGVLPNGSSRSDFVSLSVTVDLPVFRKNRQDRTLAAAVSDRRAANESLYQLQKQLNAQLDAQVSRWQVLTRRLELYEGVILSQSADRTQAALLAYQSDAGDFADVMRGHIDDLNLRLDYIRLKVERAQSYAQLANLTGIK